MPRIRLETGVTKEVHLGDVLSIRNKSYIVTVNELNEFVLERYGTESELLLEKVEQLQSEVDQLKAKILQMGANNHA